MSDLPGSVRVIALSLIGVTFFPMALTTACLLGAGPLQGNPGYPAAAATSVLLFAGLIVASAVLAGTYRADCSTQGAPGHLARSVERLLPDSGLVLVATAALAMDEDLRTSSTPKIMLLRAVVWGAVAVGCLFVLRSPQTVSSALVDRDRAVRVLVPGLLLLVISALPLVIGGSPKGVLYLLSPCLYVTAVFGGALILGLSMSAAVGGLHATLNRSQRVVRFIDARPRLLPAVVVVKLALLVAVWWVWHVVVPEQTTLAFGESTLIIATIAAMTVIVLFIIEGRVPLPSFDEPTATRIPGLVVGVAGGITGCIGLLVAGVVRSSPTRVFSVGLLALLIGLGFLFSRNQRWRAQALGYAVAILLALACSTTLVSLQTAIRPLAKHLQSPQLTIVDAAALAFYGVVLGVPIYVVVKTLRTRQFGWAIFAGTMLIWFIVFGAWDLFYKPVSFMTFDLVLTVLLGVAAVAFSMGFQHLIDGYEIVVAMVVTFLLIEFAMFTDLVPHALRAVPVIVAIVGPGAVVLWTQTAALKEPLTRRQAMMRLSLTAVTYCLAAIVIGIAPFDISEEVNKLSSFTLAFLSIPLLLLLVAAHNPRHVISVDR